jgi:hypothetical protein
MKCVFPTEIADPASGTPAEAQRNLLMSAVTDGYQQRCQNIGAQLHVVTAGLQAPVKDADRGTEDGGSEGYGSECSIAVSLDALEGYEEGLQSEEDEKAFVFRAVCLRGGEVCGEQTCFGGGMANNADFVSFFD